MMAFLLGSPLTLLAIGLLVLCPGVPAALLFGASILAYLAVDMMAVAGVTASAMFATRRFRASLNDAAAKTDFGTVFSDQWIERLTLVAKRRWPATRWGTHRLHPFVVNEPKEPDATPSVRAYACREHIFVFMNAEPHGLSAWGRYSLARTVVRAVVMSMRLVHRRAENLRWWLFVAGTALLLGQLDGRVVAIIVLADLLQLTMSLHWAIAPRAASRERVEDEFRVDYFVLTSLDRPTLTTIADALKTSDGGVRDDLITDCWVRAYRHRVAQQMLKSGDDSVPAGAIRPSLRAGALNFLTVAALLAVSQPIPHWQAIAAIVAASVLALVGAVRLTLCSPEG
jgi:hypothetical protein